MLRAQPSVYVATSRVKWETAVFTAAQRISSSILASLGPFSQVNTNSFWLLLASFLRKLLYEFSIPDIPPDAITDLMPNQKRKKNKRHEMQSIEIRKRYFSEALLLHLPPEMQTV